MQNAPNKIRNVPVLAPVWLGVWLGALNSELGIEQGGIPFSEGLASHRTGLLYDYIDISGGFYPSIVGCSEFRSRTQAVFTIDSGLREDHEWVKNFLAESNDDLGSLDVRSHRLGPPVDAIRVTMSHPQPKCL